MFAFYEKMNSCRKKCRPGGRSDFAVRLQSRFGLEAPDGFFGGGAEVAVRGLAAEKLPAAAVVAAVDQDVKSTSGLLFSAPGMAHRIKEWEGIQQSASVGTVKGRSCDETIPGAAAHTAGIAFRARQATML